MTMTKPERTGARPLEVTVTTARRIRPAWWGVTALALITLLVTTTASSYNLFVFDSILLAAMGAIALQVLQGTAGLFSVGNAAFLLIGAFTAVFVIRAGVPFPIDLIAATLIAGLGGLIVGLPALRLRGLFLVLATLAAHYIATFLGNLYQSRVPSAQAAGFFVPVLFGSYPADSGIYWSWLLFAIVSLIILAATRIIRERSGRALRMIREHEHIAPTLGIPVARYKLLIFTLSAMVIGFEGALLAHLNGSVQTANFPLTLAFQYVLMVMIGGLDSILGAVLGAAVVIGLPIVVPNIITAINPNESNPSVGANISLILYGVAVIFCVTASPDGIVGLLRSLGRMALRVPVVRRVYTSAFGE
jgi:branched-chain amino acid transport system permease protein